MGRVLIRDLDDAILTDHRRAAEANGRSLGSELRQALARARPKRPVLTGEALKALAERLWAMTPPAAAAMDSVPVIRAARDER